MECVRIYEMPPCRMAASGVGMFGDGTLERFERWFSALPRPMFPPDYLFWDRSPPGKEGFRWLYCHEAGMNVPEEFERIDFPGGLYAVVTGIDGQSAERETQAVRDFIAADGLEADPDREPLGNIITSPAAAKALGYHQMDYYWPVRPVR